MTASCFISKLLNIKKDHLQMGPARQGFELLLQPPKEISQTLISIDGQRKPYISAKPVHMQENGLIEQSLIVIE